MIESRHVIPSRPVDEPPRHADSPLPRAATGEHADRLYHAGILLTALIVLTLSFVLRIEHGRRVVVPGLNWTLPELCNFRRFLGHDCPGCGMTRGFICCARADPLKAWSQNPVSVPLFLACCLQVPYRLLQLFRLRRGEQPLDIPHVGVMTSLLAILLLGSWTMRWLMMYT